MDFYKTLLVSQSGKGKTYSARNLNPETTGFINVEGKPLPFKNKFKNYIVPKSHTDALVALKAYIKEEEITCIFFDSFSAFTDLLLTVARQQFKGFDVWNYYNTEITNLLMTLKYANKEIFVTTHYELLMNEGYAEKRAKVKGKEWEGMIEKEFTIVLYGENKFENPNKKPEYYFVTVLEDGSAKCPPDILGEDIFKIENDANLVLEKINAFKDND